jgi:hypothetical protein
MKRIVSRIVLMVILAVMAVPALSGSAAAQELPPPNPVDLPCVTNVSAQMLSSGPVHDSTQTLVLARIVLDPGGSIGAHTHPGHLAAVVESGTLGFTLLDDGEMTIKRAATADSVATPEAIVRDQQIAMSPGDSLFEMGMVHNAINLDDGQTTYLIAGLIEAGQPLTACVDAGSPVGHVSAVQ